MARVATLLALARKIVRERSRPGRAGIVTAVVGVVVTVRFLANAYLAVLMGERLDATSGAAFLPGALLLLGLYAASAGAARAYRTTTVLLDHPRLRAAVVARGRIRGVTAVCATLRLAAAHLAVLAAVAAGVSTVLWGWRGPMAAQTIAVAAAGAAASVLSYIALRAGGLGVHAAEYVEILSLLLLALANPALELVDGSLAIVALGRRLPRTVLSATAVLATVTAGVFALALATRLTHALLRRASAGPKAARTAGNPLLRLYRSALPVALLAVTYVVEIPLVLGSAMTRTELLRLSLGLLALRAGWYLLYLARTESRFEARRPLTLLTQRALMRRLLSSAPIHAVLCAAPLALHLIP